MFLFSLFLAFYKHCFPSLDVHRLNVMSQEVSQTADGRKMSCECQKQHRQRQTGLSYVALEKHVLWLQSFKKYYSEFVFYRHEQANDSITAVFQWHIVLPHVSLLWVIDSFPIMFPWLKITSDSGSSKPNLLQKFMWHCKLAEDPQCATLNACMFCFYVVFLFFFNF